jgi:hypothetical protein
MEKLMAKRVKSVRQTSVEPNEPIFNSAAENVQGELGRILNWYSYNKSTDDARKYFLSYLKKHDMDVFEKLKTKSSEISITTTIGWLCRIYTLNESLFPTKYLKNIKDETSRVMSVVTQEELADLAEVQKTKKPKAGVQEHLQNQLRVLLGVIDGEVDKFLSNKSKSDFDMYEWLKQNKTKHVHAKGIADYYEKVILAELKEAQSGECEQLTEGYSFLSKKQLNNFVSFVEKLIEDANKWQGIAKQISQNNRVPRAKKPKPALKQVEKLQYMKEYGNLKSVPPTQIVGATQLWIYNTKYKSLGVYVCTNAHGFSVKGCTILNYDVNESTSKTLRKPEEVIPSVLESGKVALRKILPSLRTKEKKLTGRINKDTILLRVV